MNNTTTFTATAAAARTLGNPHVGLIRAKGHAPANLVDLLDVVVNKRLRKTWRVRVDFKTGARLLFIPPVLADAPEEIKDCLARWALMPVGRKALREPNYVKTKRNLEIKIREYMESRGVSCARKSRLDPKTLEHQTKGFVFDLQAIFDTVNRVYFGGKIKSYIRWGHAASRTSYQDTRVDKNGNAFNLITISGVYDSPKVPEYAIYGLIYHEMLHIAIPPTKTADGRRIIHGREFRAAMKQYPYYREWAEWEKANIGRLIANARKLVRRRKKMKIFSF